MTKYLLLLLCIKLLNKIIGLTPGQGISYFSGSKSNLMYNILIQYVINIDLNLSKVCIGCCHRLTEHNIVSRHALSVSLQN